MSSQKLRRVNMSNSINNKIIEPLKDGAFVVGPGQMATPLTKQIANGVKLSSRKKRKHTDSQSDYQSLDEMLTDPNLSLNYGNTDGLPNGTDGTIPTAGNLAITLVQGLQSQNEKMISTVLDRQDSFLIRETVHNLPNEMVEEFLKRLHKLFFNKGDKLIHYHNWLTTLLQEKLSVILMSQSAQQELTSLKQLFATRCDIFDRMCALKGRLSLISSLMEPNVKDKDSTVKSKTINYQESSSEEEEDDDDDDEDSSGQDSDRDLERIVVMDLSDTENNSQEGDEEEDDEEDDEEELDVDDDADGDDEENDDDDNDNDVEDSDGDEDDDENNNSD